MKKTITMTCWKRPDYFQQAVACIAAANYAGYEVIFSLEPDGPEEMVEIMKRLKHDTGLRVHIVRNRKRKGLAQNPKSALTYAFENLGSDMNVYMEEDVTQSPDFLDIANWFWELPEREEFICLNYFSFTGTGDDPGKFTEYHGFDPGKNKKIIGPERPFIHQSPFNSYGAVMTKSKWEEWFKPNWPDFGERIRMGWNWTMGWALVRDANAKTIRPDINRGKHIGMDGLNMSVSPQNRKYFQRLRLYDGKYRGPYRLER